MSGRIVTAAEALALLDAREAKGAWRAGTVEAEGKVWARDPDALGGPSVGEVCVFNANTYRPHNGNRALAAAAPDLAATVVAQAAEIERLTRELTAARAALRNENAARVALHRVTSAMPFALSDVLSDDERDALDHCTDEDHAVAMRAAEVSR